MLDAIDYAKRLFNSRAGTRGVSSNVGPDRFNLWFHNAELRFFNERYDDYAKRQTISDSISKWLTDPIYLPVDPNGFFQFWAGMNLLHVDSMSDYLTTTGTMIATFVTPPGIISSLGTLVNGSGYTPGIYSVPLTGGAGTGAFADVTVNGGGTVANVAITDPGRGYLIGNTLTATIPAGTGWSINVASVTYSQGTGYTPGNYPNTPLTGGSGIGATVFITVGDAGTVISVLPQLQGGGYAVNDILSASLPGGSGFNTTVASLTGATKDYPVTRVEKQLWSANTSSSYDAPTQQFAIYTQFTTSFQFLPTDIGFAKIIYLQQPIWSVWGYNLQGYIATLTGLVGGSSYTNGVYTNVPLTGGLGNSALATITIAGNVVTSVVITNPGKIYANGDFLSASNANLGGTGTGFRITVSSLVPGSIRPIYNPATSVQPLWNNDDLSTIVDLALSDASISARDKELTAFSEKSQQSQQ